MNNASGNLKEVLNLIANGVDVQFETETFGEWRDLKNISFILTEAGLRLKWRKKPDAFQEWFQNNSELLYSDEDAANAGWQAAIRHMEKTYEQRK